MFDFPLLERGNIPPTTPAILIKKTPQAPHIAKPVYLLAVKVAAFCLTVFIIHVFFPGGVMPFYVLCASAAAAKVAVKSTTLYSKSFMFRIKKLSLEFIQKYKPLLMIAAIGACIFAGINLALAKGIACCITGSFGVLIGCAR